MRLNIILLFLFLGASIGFSQEVMQQPILVNPILKAKTMKETEEWEAVLRKVETPPHSISSQNRGPKKFIDTLFVVSGDSLKFNVDTSGYLLDTLFMLKDSWKYGACSPVYFNNIPNKTDEFKYQSQKGITLGKDTVRIVFDYGNPKTPNDTLCYWVIVKRANQTIKMDVAHIRAEKDTILCTSTIGLTGKLVSSTLRECAIESIAKAKRKAYQFLDTCVYYRASRLGGLDTTTCLLLCDENEVCDNFIFSVKVHQDTLSEKDSETFMDDFSYSGPYPNPRLWLDDRVFINSTMASQPPSVGMATFDGLNYTGSPYGNGYGISDVLTSAYLDLSNPITKYLSFYVEPKGLGFSPDLNEPIIVEFKTAENQWNIIQTISPLYYYSVSDPSPGFQQYAFEISDKKYLYKGFQFRFRAYGNRVGITDLWNLDYVRISKDNPQVNGKPAAFNDLTFTRTPSSIFKNYTAAPWKHIKGFENQEVRTSLETDLYSHFDALQNVNNSDANITEIKTGTNLIENYSYFPASVLNITPQIHINKSEEMQQAQRDKLIQNIQQIPANEENLTFVKTLSFDVSKEQDKSYAAVSQNDKVSSTTVCSNYFAYDDGTAELAIATIGTESQLQVRFRANVDDTLRAVLLHFPHYNKDISSFRFNLRVFVGALGKTPTYEKLFLKPSYPDKYTEVLQGFTQYVLTDEFGVIKPLYIPKGDFYVGWQQVTTGDEPFVVGYDANNPQAMANNFKNTTGLWKPLAGIKGAVMLRPKLSSDAKQVLNTSEQVNLKAAIYPNPANEYLNIQVEGVNFKDFSYSIFNLNGSLVQKGDLTEVVDIQSLVNGFYIVKIQNSKGNMVYRQKISIIK